MAKKQNKYIAEFMEHKTPLNYHKSWDLLMPVIEKIEKNYAEVSMRLDGDIQEHGKLELFGCRIRTYTGFSFQEWSWHESKIKSVWNAVWVFCEFYIKYYKKGKAGMYYKPSQYPVYNPKKAKYKNV